MKRSLIFIYGLPGVGKLTVAKELSNQTKFPIYHNHLTSDLVYSVFDRGEIGSLLKQKIRNLVIGDWAKYEDTSLITTLIYKKGDNEDYFEQMSNSAKEFGITIYYFHLICNLESLKERVVSPDRKKFGKIVEWNELEEKMKNCNMTEELPYENNYTIDTTNLSPAETAKQIVEVITSTNS
jgi:tRNA uridine 5-carbamoylmethylation protein Kti12